MYRRCRCCWGWDVIHWWCTEPWTWTSAITNSKGQAPNIFCVCLQRKPRRVLCINMLFLFFSTCMCAYTHVYAPLLYSYMWHKMENLTQCFPVSCLHYIIILGIVFILSHCTNNLARFYDFGSLILFKVVCLSLRRLVVRSWWSIVFSYLQTKILTNVIAQIKIINFDNGFTTL